MKTMLITLALFPVLAWSGENPVHEDPFAVPEPKLSAFDLPVSVIDLKAGQSVQDAVQQIVAGLSPEGRRSFVVDVPEAELGKLKLKGDLRLRNVPLMVLCNYLEQKAPVGCSLRHGVWHLSTERADDVIAVKYRLGEQNLSELGIMVGPQGMIQTKHGSTWPNGSGEWRATYEADVLRVLATRSFHDEIAAVLLLRSRGYSGCHLADEP